MSTIHVASFYRFLDLPDAEAFCNALHGRCSDEALLGTVLVANEGFNGTLAGGELSLRRVFDWIRERCHLEDELDARWTEASEAPFKKLRVKVKNEIVTLGRPDLRPHERTGVHVDPEHWNALLEDPDVTVIDTRNRYEIEVGSFPGAIDPGNDSFREFPTFAAQLAEASTDKKLAMFCTGGIRCEKATALMLDLGFKDVYHLQGGILNYLAKIADADNHWNGECFVFDKRVAVDRDLAEGGYVQCHACRRPLGAADIDSEHYVEGISCPKCIHEKD